MAKSRVFSRPLPDANVPRNAFDMSKRISLNMPFGALIPVYSHQYIAGSHVKINMRTFFRTAAVNTAAFPQLKLNFEWFAVPLRYLWSYWDNYKLGIQDYNSTAVALPNSSGVVQNPSTIPSFNRFYLQHLIYQNGDTSAGGWKDDCEYSWNDGAARLCDFLGYGRISPSIDFVDYATRVQSMNPFKALAYQKIFYDHFRNTAYQNNDPFAYNIDAASVASRGLSFTDLKKIFTLRYANYRKDYFQHIFPSLNYVSSSPDRPLTSLPSWITGLAGVVSTGSDYSRWSTQAGGNMPSAASNNNVITAGQSLYSSSQSSFIQHTHDVSSVGYNVQSIRAAFALDKLLRSSAYAPKHVKEQYEARYGIKFSDKSSYESERIGNFDTDIVIGEVTSTANTSSGSSGDALGAIGGKGIGASEAKKGFVDYTCNEDCIVMCIAYAIPRQQYDSTRFENWNMKLSQNDFFIPEFMNMGLKPLYRKEIYNDNVVTDNNYIVGYQTPYMEYKADVDENHGLFADPNSDLGQFVMHTNQPYTGSASQGANAYYFRVKPSDVDSIFVNQYDGTESTDQLFGQIDFILPVNQNMSVHGQPSL